MKPAGRRPEDMRLVCTRHEDLKSQMEAVVVVKEVFLISVV